MRIKTFVTSASILTIFVAMQASGIVDVSASGDQAITSTSSTNVVSVKASAVNKRAEHVYNKFLILVQQPNQLKNSHKFLKAHIYEVNSYQAGLMTLRLENAQQAALDTWSDKFFVDSVQENIAKIYKQNDSFDTLIARTTSSSLRTLFQDAKDSGYKLETAEGTFFPVIDYEFSLKNYRPYVMPAIKNYLDIMSVESAHAPAKDAALMISWDEVAKRALAQEAYLKLYPNSNRTKQIENLYQNYIIYSVYGLNNTPLFDYDTQSMNPEAKDSYLALLAEKGTTDSDYLLTLQSYMDVLKDNNYKLNATVEKFRKEYFPSWGY
ncbi:hypothetical protein [Paenibacillus crassostreae]|uniref:Uncharacterized protein n=1 Tax=Paenibacillus crassostreae TaxID=1763538 RepID=A0A167B065_9BACL|nr:hypothetical protein [Paenibacillus crassostreae]AOZ93589.1 hypothetical protein LPB68_16260 [Paenibacillus crassostreae]OAB71621.1 hypothetical protein PNBC_19130 [Paenibacillus crassostreae]